MSRLQKKIMRHAKKQESMSHIVGGKRVVNWSFLWEWPDVEFIRKRLKLAIKKTVTELKKTMIKEVKEGMMNIYQIENISRKNLKTRNKWKF